ncbi:META domain-containing protein [Gordonia sp. TBRC 11910]|uniref:META domain-containing protein n=1 Tax=Gordonia asplenii TaxID=2725283 RepID=A0A848KMJ2_9ACTN|nr:META domain-containing protein [Gordonia asplenii]NMO00304.1 META domain-containing protein [Gordonia asplenii]
MPAPTRPHYTLSFANRTAFGVAVAAVAATIAIVVSSVAAAAPSTAPAKPAKPAPAVKTALSGRTFISDTVSGNNPLPGGASITMRFGSTNQISINSGCNTMRSTVDLAKNHFTVAQPMASTKNFCPTGADQWLTAFLTSKPVWRLSDADLVLANRDVRMRLVDRKEAADRPLVGTQWSVTALIQKGAVVDLPTTVTPAPTVRFSDFQVNANTGCNGLTGPAVPVTSMIVFGPVFSSGRVCKDAGRRRVDAGLVAAMNGLQTYVIDGKKLTVVNTSGVGFIARTDR